MMPGRWNTTPSAMWSWISGAAPGGRVIAILIGAGVVLALGVFLLITSAPLSHTEIARIADKRIAANITQDKPAPERSKLIAALTTLSDLGRKDAIKDFDRGNLSAALMALETLALSREADPLTQKQAARTHRDLGAVAFLNDTDKALNAYQKAIDLDPENPEGWNVLGHLFDHTGNKPDAENAYKQMLALSIRASDKKNIAIANNHLGLFYMKLAYHSVAKNYLEKSLALATEIGDDDINVSSLENLGALALEESDWDSARDYFLRTLDLYQKSDYAFGMANAYSSLGVLAHEQGNDGEAENYLHQAMHLFDDLNNDDGLARQYHALGNVEKARGAPKKAEDHYRAALSLFEATGNTQGMAAQFSALGTLYTNTDKVEKAEIFFRKSLALYQQIDDREGMAAQHLNLGKIYNAQEDHGATCDSWRRSRALYQALTQAMADKLTQWMSQASCVLE